MHNPSPTYQPYSIQLDPASIAAANNMQKVLAEKAAKPKAGMQTVTMETGGVNLIWQLLGLLADATPTRAPITN